MLEYTQRFRHLRCWIFVLWFCVIVEAVATIGSANDPQLPQETCTRERLASNKNSFRFRKLGNGSSLEDCVDYCCRDDTCELAMFSRAHCYGVSCHTPELCHQILDRLLMEDEKQLKRNPRNAGTTDFIRHTSQVANPRCPQRFVPSFHLLLLGSGPHVFRILRAQPISASQCRAHCCKSCDCLLSFIEDSKCYGVIGRRTEENGTNSEKEPTVGLQVAIIDRNKEISRSLDDEDYPDDDPDNVGSEEVNKKLSTKKRVPSTINRRTNTRKPEVYHEQFSKQNPEAERSVVKNGPLVSTKVPTMENREKILSTIKRVPSPINQRPNTRKPEVYHEHFSKQNPEAERSIVKNGPLVSTKVLSMESRDKKLSTIKQVPSTTNQRPNSRKPEVYHEHFSKQNPVSFELTEAERSIAQSGPLISTKVATIQNRSVQTSTYKVNKTTEKPSALHKQHVHFSKQNPVSFELAEPERSIAQSGPLISTKVQTMQNRSAKTSTYKVNKTTEKPSALHKQHVDASHFHRPIILRNKTHLQSVSRTTSSTTLSQSKTIHTYTTPTVKTMRNGSKTHSPTVKTDRTRLLTVKNVARQSSPTVTPSHKLKGFFQVEGKRTFKPTTKAGVRTTKLQRVQTQKPSSTSHSTNAKLTKRIDAKIQIVKNNHNSSFEKEVSVKRWTIPHVTATHNEIESTSSTYKNTVGNANGAVMRKIGSKQSTNFAVQDTRAQQRVHDHKTTNSRKNVDLVKDLDDLGSDDDNDNNAKEHLERILPLLRDQHNETKTQKKHYVTGDGHQVPHIKNMPGRDQALKKGKLVKPVSGHETIGASKVSRKLGSNSKMLSIPRHLVVNRTGQRSAGQEGTSHASLPKGGANHRNISAKKYDNTPTTRSPSLSLTKVKKEDRKRQDNRHDKEIARDQKTVPAIRRTKGVDGHKRPATRLVASTKLQNNKSSNLLNPIGKHNKTKGFHKILVKHETLSNRTSSNPMERHNKSRGIHKTLVKQETLRNRTHSNPVGKHDNWNRTPSNLEEKHRLSVQPKQLTQNYKHVFKNAKVKIKTAPSKISATSETLKVTNKGPGGKAKPGSSSKDKDTALRIPVNNREVIGKDHVTGQKQIKTEKNTSASGSLKVKSSVVHKQTKDQGTKSSKSKNRTKKYTVLGEDIMKPLTKTSKPGIVHKNPSILGEDDDGSEIKPSSKPSKLNLQMEEEDDLMKYASPEISVEKSQKYQTSETRHAAKPVKLKKTTPHIKDVKKSKETSTKTSNGKDELNINQLETFHKSHTQEKHEDIKQGKHPAFHQSINSTTGKPSRKEHKLLEGNHSMSVHPTVSTGKKLPNGKDKLVNGKIVMSVHKTTPPQVKSSHLEQASLQERSVIPTPPTSSLKAENSRKQDIGNHNVLKQTGLPVEEHNNGDITNTTSDVLAHFLQDGSASDGVDFSVGSTGKHHKGKKSKSSMDDSLDVEDLGDADFDIMMSNDIPHKKEPGKGSKKDGDGKHPVSKNKDRSSKGGATAAKRVQSKDKVVVGEDDDETTKGSKTKHKHNDNLEENDKKRHSSHRHHDHQTKDDSDEEQQSSEIAKQAEKAHKVLHHNKKRKESSTASQEDSDNKHRHKMHKVHEDERKKTHKHTKSHKHVEDENNRGDEVKTSKDSHENKGKSHRHHKQKHSISHKKHYYDNKWSGKIIPGIVKVPSRPHKEDEKKHEEEKQDDDGNEEGHKKHKVVHHHKRKEEKESKKRKLQKMLESLKDDDDDVNEKRHEVSKRKHMRHHGVDDEKRESRKHREENHEEEEDQEKHGSHKHDREEKQDEEEEQAKRGSHKHHREEIHHEDEDQENQEEEEDQEKHGSHKHHGEDNHDEEEEQAKDGSHKHHRENNHQEDKDQEKHGRHKHHGEENHDEDNDQKRYDGHKHRKEDEHENENDQKKNDRAEKRTDVNYEVVKKGRHGSRHHEELPVEKTEQHNKDSSEEDGNSGVESDHKDDDDDDNDNDDDNQNKDKVDKDKSKNDDDTDEQDDHSDEETKGSRVVLGEDSDDDTEDEGKHSEKKKVIHRRKHKEVHDSEHDDAETDEESYRSNHHRRRHHDNEHKPTFRRKYYHKKSSHKQHDSQYRKFKGKEGDDKTDNYIRNDGRIIYRERNGEDKKSELHHGRARHREGHLDRNLESDVDKHEEESRHYAEKDRIEDHKQENTDYRHHGHHVNKNYPKEESDDNEDRDTSQEVSGRHPHKFENDESRSRGYDNQDKHFDENEDTPEGQEHEKYVHHHEETNAHDREHESDHRFSNEYKFHGEMQRQHAEENHHERPQEEQKFSDDENVNNNGPSNNNYFREKEDPYKADNMRYRGGHKKTHTFGRKHEAWERHKGRGNWKNRDHFHGHREHDDGSIDSSAWMFNEEGAEDDSFRGGESRHGKHWKKHRKHRQSYDYWGYGKQYPNYYDYNKAKRPYGYYPPSPPFRAASEWQKQQYQGYGRWRPKPTSRWYEKYHDWAKKAPWRSHSRWPVTPNAKPGKNEWQKPYDDMRGAMTPTPKYAPSWMPTSSSWQPSRVIPKGPGKGDWPSRQTQGADRQYKNWSGYNQPSPTRNWEGNKFMPHQNDGPGPPPWQTLYRKSKENIPTPPGVQSKYYPPAAPQKGVEIGNKTRFHPTVRRQYSGTVAPQTSKPANLSKIANIINKLNLQLPVNAPSADPGKGPSVVGQVKQPSNGRLNGSHVGSTRSDKKQDINRLNGFFDEERGGKKKSDIEVPGTKGSQVSPTSQNLSSPANGTQHNPSSIPKSTSPPIKLQQPRPTQMTNKTTMSHTTPIKTSEDQTRKPSNMSHDSSTTALPKQKTTTDAPPGPQSFGDVSPDDTSEERGNKHRKHRAPVCMAGKITDDLTLRRGKRAGNFTNIGDVGDFEMCIKRCCQHKKCDLAFKSAETCFLVHCFSKESCQTSPSLDDIFSPRMCVVKRHLRDNQDDFPEPTVEGGGDDKVSPSGIHEVCDAERALGILWKKTAAGRSSKHPCPRDAKGFVKRRCEADSRWLPPDFSECVSADYQSLYEKSKSLAVGADPSPLIRELSQLTTQNIDNSLIFGGDLDRATDIMAAIVQHNGQTDLLDMTREDVENFVRASSNLLDMTNQQEWSYIQMDKPGSADVLRSMEMFALQAAMRLPREEMSDPTITNNIIIKMDRKSAGDEGLTFPDFSNPKINRWDARRDVIALPASVFDRGEVSTASISFKSLPYLLPDSNVSSGLGPNSKVLSTVLHPHPQEKITPPVTIVLSHIKRRRGNPKCVFWDYTLNPHKGGAWSSRGCWLAYSNQSHSICQCNHLSNFAVLMDLSSDEVAQKEQKKERTMALMWIGIPVLIVGVIGALYMSFSWNRKSGIPSTVTRPAAALNEKTGLLGQRVVTSQVREEFPSSPSRDLYRALSPGYSPTSGDLEWQDEFDFDEVESGDHGFKKMLLPRLQLLQNQLINEFYEGDKTETKQKFLESKIQPQPQITPKRPTQTRAVQPVLRQKTRSAGRKLRVRFADESLPRRNLTDDDKQRFNRLQRMERRVFIQHLSRWRANSHLDLSE